MPICTTRVTMKMARMMRSRMVMKMNMRMSMRIRMVKRIGVTKIKMARIRVLMKN